MISRSPQKDNEWNKCLKLLREDWEILRGCRTWHGIPIGLPVVYGKMVVHHFRFAWSEIEEIRASRRQFQIDVDNIMRQLATDCNTYRDYLKNELRELSNLDNIAAIIAGPEESRSVKLQQLAKETQATSQQFRAELLADLQLAQKDIELVSRLLAGKDGSWLSRRWRSPMTRARDCLDIMHAHREDRTKAPRAK